MEKVISNIFVPAAQTQREIIREQIKEDRKEKEEK